MVRHNIILEDEDVQFIVAICDVALKAHGLAYLNAVGKLLAKMPNPNKVEAQQEQASVEEQEPEQEADDEQVR
jgi:hypothetical protein